MPFVDPGLGPQHRQPLRRHPQQSAGATPGRTRRSSLHRFGKGRAVWVAAPFESVQEKVNHQLFLALLRRILAGPYRFEVDTHPAVEMTLFHQPEKKRLLAGLLNLQRQLPQVPVAAGVRVLPLPGRPVRRVVRLPQQTPVPFTKAEPYVEFRVEPFDTLAMFALDYA